MIKLLGVIAEGGVPIIIKSLEDIKGKTFIAGLIEAVKALSSIVGAGEIRKLDFKEYKLIIYESKKKYTIVALVDTAEEYVEKILSIIASEIDRGSIPRFGGIVDNDLVNKITKIIDKYVSETIGVDIVGLIVDVWGAIFNEMKSNKAASEVISRTEQMIEEATRTQEEKWYEAIQRNKGDSKMAIKYALDGDFDHACILTQDESDPLMKAFSIKMGLLASSMISTISPPLRVLEELSNDLPDSDPLYKLIKSAVDFRLQKISLIDYANIFNEATKSFKFIDDDEHLIKAFFFIDGTIRLFPDFAKKLAEFFKEKSLVIYTFIASILERDKLIKKAYSISKYPDIEQELEKWRSQLDVLLDEMREVIKPSFLKRVLGMAPKGAEANKLVLKCMQGLETYLMILTLLSQSPILGLDDRKKILTEIIKLYANYFRDYLNSNLTCFAATVANVFQSVGIALAETFQLLTHQTKQKYAHKIQNVYRDACNVLFREYPKMNLYVPYITTMTSSLSLILVTLKKLYVDELSLVYMMIKMIDPRIVESWKIVIPYNYAAFTANLTSTLAFLASRVLKSDKKVEAIKKCISILVDIHKWLLMQGKVSRESVIILAYLISQIMDSLDADDLGVLVEFLIALSKIAIPDMRKNDYDVAIVAEYLVDVLVYSSDILGNKEFESLAKEISEIAVNAWRKYGFKKKANEVKKKFEGLLEK